jgi:hypothetical protein
MKDLLLLILCLVFFFIVTETWAGQAQKDAAVKTTDSAITQVATTEKTVISDGKSVFHAFKDGKYRTAIAILISMIIFFWRRFLSAFIIKKLSPWWVGFVTVFLGFVGTLPSMLASPAFSWSNFIWSGLLTSAEAMLFWQMIGKKALPKVFGELKQ